MTRKLKTEVILQNARDREKRLGRKPCRNCEKVYQRTREWQLFCSDSCRHAWNEATNTCFYCGDVAEARDHVVPVREIGRRTYVNVETVPICKDCNHLLGGTSDENFRQRMVRLIGKHITKTKLRDWFTLEEGYRPPLWDESELDELGPSLKRKVKAKLDAQRLAEERLLYMQGVLFAWNRGWTDER